MKVKNILVSQPTPAIFEKSPFYELSTKYGAHISFHPFIRVEGVSLKDFRSQRVEILEHTVVIFTSRTTVDHFFRICEEARITVPETMRYLCNTEAVALYLQKYIVYRKRKIAFANGSFSDFMELILKYKDEKFLLILSEPHKPELPDTMTKLKLKFDKVILSRTVSSDVSDVKPADYDLMVFYSPSEIATLVAAFGIANLPMIGTFGDGTTRSAIEAGLPVMVMAPTPGIPSMTRAIDLFVGKVNKGQAVEPVCIGEKRECDEFMKAQAAKPAKRKRPAVSGNNGKEPAAVRSTAIGSAANKDSAVPAAAMAPSAAADTRAKKGA